MPSIRLEERHGGFGIKFSPFFHKYLACATSKNFGLKGCGSLTILENDGTDHLKVRKCSTWPNALLDVSWYKINEGLLATSSSDGSIQIWGLFGDRGSQPLKILKDHILDVVCIETNKNLIASASWDSNIKIWDTEHALVITTMRGFQEIVHSVKWSRTFPNLLLSVSDQYHLALWDKSQPLSSVHRVTSQDSDALDCDWSYTKPYDIVVCSSDGNLRLWDIRSLRHPYLVMQNINKAVGKVRWSPHHPNIIATASYDLSTGIWDISQSSLLETVRHHSGFIYGLDFNVNVPDEIADSGLDSLIHVFTPWSLLEFTCRRFFRNKL